MRNKADKNKPGESISRITLPLIRELAAADSIVQKWENSAYGEVQKITNPTKGVLGERLTAEWLEKLGYLSEEHGYVRRPVKEGKGKDNFDLLVLVHDELERVEVKLATQDVNGKYQFNWIAIDHDVAFIVFLGIDPDGVFLSVKTSGEIRGYIQSPTPGRKLTPVPPGSKTHVKWTASKEKADMVEVKILGDVKTVFDEAMKKLKEEKNSSR